MSIAESLRTHLAFLRRYARALTGSQDRGDQYVRVVLETLVADPSSLPDEADTRIALYKMVGRVWESAYVESAGSDDALAWERAAGQRLSALPPAARQCFLLISVEGFTVSETARILDIDEDDVTRFAEAAARDIADQVSTSVLIIEDEPMIALEIEQLVQDLGHRVTSIARTHAEAIAAYDAETPGLVLADIQLADGTSGIDAVNDFLGKPEMAPPIIFITAFPERLLTGDRPEPTFLVTKPFSPDMVKAIISQALFFDTATNDSS